MNNPIKVAIKLRTSIITERFSLNSLFMSFYLKYNFSDKIFKSSGVLFLINSPLRYKSLVNFIPLQNN